MRRLFLVVAVTLLAAGSAWAQFPVGNLTPTVCAPTYALGQTVGLMITNTGPGPVTWGDEAEVVHSCLIYDSLHQLVFNGPSAITPAVYDPFTLLPGQSTTLQWHQNYLGVSKSGQVPAGTYYFATQSSGLLGAARFEIVPEPGSIVALLSGLGGICVAFRRRRRG